MLPLMRWSARTHGRAHCDGTARMIQSGTLITSRQSRGSFWTPGLRAPVPASERPAKRPHASRSPQPTAAVIDAQSTKTTEKRGPCGYVERRFTNEDGLLGRYASYYLSFSGLKLLKHYGSPQALKNMRKDATASESFVVHNIAIGDVGCRPKAYLP